MKRHVLMFSAIAAFTTIASGQTGLHSYVETASELTSRARANVYFHNPQSLFAGVQSNFVNAGTGNLTFLRRDLVTSGPIPLMLARVYDSSHSGGVDFGQGWLLSCAETISVEDHVARLSSESATTIEFTETSTDRFVLMQDRPSDYVNLVRLGPATIRATLRTGFTKEFTLIENLYRLTSVTDRNGNQAQLIYDRQLLSKLQNENHFIEFTRNPQGRIILAEDDQGRRVQFFYNAKKELTETHDLGSAHWKYRYFDGGHLQSATDPMGRVNFAVVYQQDGRVHRLRLPSGTVVYDYDLDARSTTVTDRRQHVSRFFQNTEGITVRVINALGAETAIDLDANRNAVSLSRNGALVEKLEYGQDHHLLRRESFGDSRAIESRYNYLPMVGLLTGIDSNNGVSRAFHYDSRGNLAAASIGGSLHKYSYSATGDLTAFWEGKTHFEFKPNPDGLIASFKDSDGSVTSFDYKPGGGLSEAQFAGGQTAKYDYQPSGLRSRLTYQDKRRVEYVYDPVGNLLATAIFDSKGKQVQGQKLTLNDSYQVTKRVLFDGTQESFEYDPNGNLTKHVKNGAVTRFEYDELDRLMAVVTPAGEHLNYSYAPGEHSLVEQYEHSEVTVADLRDTSFTFAAPMQVMAVRPITAPLGVMRFSENLGTFQLANVTGTEIITPDVGIEQALQKLTFTTGSSPLRQRQNSFNRPFNTIFMPAEYATINCCFSCSVAQCRPGLTDGGDTSSCCPPCDPAPPGGTPTPPPPIPSIAQQQQLWWFNGANPPSFTAGSTQITLVASPNDSSLTYIWNIVSGSDKVLFANSSTSVSIGSNNTVSIKSIGKSTQPGDVQISITVDNGSGRSTATFSTEVRAPTKLVPNGAVSDRGVVGGCFVAGAGGYASLIPYQIRTQFDDVVFNSGISEAFGARQNAQPNNWPLEPLGAATPQGVFADLVCNAGSTENPLPSPPQNPLSSTMVDQSQQSWFAGYDCGSSLNQGRTADCGPFYPGIGVRSQTNTLVRYIDHGRHTSIISPAP